MKKNSVTYARHFLDGYTPIIKIGEEMDAGMNFGSLKMRKGEREPIDTHFETAYLLMIGRVNFFFKNEANIVERTSYFDEDPILLHCAKGESGYIEALTDCEILIIQAENSQSFEPILFDQHNMLERDERGKGLLDDTSYRIVRTIFDKRNRLESNLVVGEIITFQGHWSSYPSHYHPQPEVYHYRFSEPQGFAFGENGEEVIRIQHNDTYKIVEGQEHAHCTAPGYALYTLWFIRHLPHEPYYVPTFRPEHEWTRHASANQRVWQMRKK